jgi:hypothetical protein
MKLFNRLSKRSPDEAPTATGEDSQPTGDDLPIPGYDRMKEREIVVHLRELSQVELEAVERYERSHEDRAAVLDKLRYMRSPEPVEGYDTLTANEVAEALDGADGQSVKAIRDYERKFQHRRQVLDEAARVLPDAPESEANARSREEKTERVRTSMRRAPGNKA